VGITAILEVMGCYSKGNMQKEEEKSELRDKY
jgi:hypothetical protein